MYNNESEENNKDSFTSETQKNSSNDLWFDSNGDSEFLSDNIRETARVTNTEINDNVQQIDMANDSLDSSNFAFNR